MQKIYLIIILVVIAATAFISLERRKCLENTEWENIVQLIKNGEVRSAGQTHSLCIGVTTKEGKHYDAKEPQIDAIYYIIKECGEPCSNITFLTE